MVDCWVFVSTTVLCIIFIFRHVWPRPILVRFVFVCVRGRHYIGRISWKCFLFLKGLPTNSALSCASHICLKRIGIMDSFICIFSVYVFPPHDGWMMTRQRRPRRRGKEWCISRATSFPMKTTAVGWMLVRYTARLVYNDTWHTGNLNRSVFRSVYIRGVPYVLCCTMLTHTVGCELRSCSCRINNNNNKTEPLIPPHTNISRVSIRKITKKTCTIIVYTE